MPIGGSARGGGGWGYTDEKRGAIAQHWDTLWTVVQISKLLGSNLANAGMTDRDRLQDAIAHTSTDCLDQIVQLQEQLKKDKAED